MTAYAMVNGTRQTFKQRAIASATPTTLIEAPNRLFTLDSVLATNITGSAATFTLEIYDGSNATALVKAVSVAANTVYQFKDHHITLGPTDLLRVQSGTNGAFDVTAVGFEAQQTGK